MLEPHGLQRTWSFGTDGFSRIVGLSIITANLVRVGRLLRNKERVPRRRAEPFYLNHPCLLTGGVCLLTRQDAP